MRTYNKFERCAKFLVNCFNKRDNKVWAFTEWYGKRCGDNATFFANYIAEQYPDIHIFWFAAGDMNASMLDKRIRIVRKDSPEAMEVLKKAAVVVMLQGIDEFSDQNINLCGNALKVNLWHGVMWKKLGFDITGGLKFPQTISVAIKNNFVRKYMFEAPSEVYKKIFMKAFAIKEKEIVCAGQPRNRLFFDAEMMGDSRKRIRERIQTLTTAELRETTRIITYMPTFRDNVNDVFNFSEVSWIDQLDQFLEKEDIILVQKAHFISNERLGNVGSEGKSKRIVTNNDFAAQELLAATDLLVTDYSSCFFDYLLLDRPIVHFLYDYEYYANKDRGLYFSWEEVVCGDVSFEEADLFDRIAANLAQPDLHHELREQRRKKFLEYESPDSCATIAKEIMRRI